MVRTRWLRFYDPGECPDRFDEIVQSWDTANKATELSDYSVCTTWGVHDEYYYLLELCRERRPRYGPDLGLRTRIHRASPSQLAAALPRMLTDLPTPNYTSAGVRKGPGGTTQWKRSGCWHSPTG